LSAKKIQAATALKRTREAGVSSVLRNDVLFIRVPGEGERAAHPIIVNEILEAVEALDPEDTPRMLIRLLEDPKESLTELVGSELSLFASKTPAFYLMEFLLKKKLEQD
jgi:hypothetical protein